jgi:hypothetical protein
VQNPWRPEEVRSKELNLVVEEVSDAEVRLRLEGAASLKREKGDFPYGYEADFMGVLVYDRKKAGFTRFDVLALGDWTWGYERKDAPQKDILGVALELWPREFASPAYDRHFPGWNMSNYGYRQDRE